MERNLILGNVDRFSIHVLMIFRSNMMVDLVSDYLVHNWNRNVFLNGIFLVNSSSPSIISRRLVPSHSVRCFDRYFDQMGPLGSPSSNHSLINSLLILRSFSNRIFSNSCQLGLRHGTEIE